MLILIISLIPLDFLCYVFLITGLIFSYSLFYIYSYFLKLPVLAAAPDRPSCHPLPFPRLSIYYFQSYYYFPPLFKYIFFYTRRHLQLLTYILYPFYSLIIYTLSLGWIRVVAFPHSPISFLISFFCIFTINFLSSLQLQTCY